MFDLYAGLVLAPEDEIRLVDILPKGQNEDVAVELQVVKLRDDPKFIALSYTWGSPTALTNGEGVEDKSSKPSYPILCRAKPESSADPPGPWGTIMVTENLHAFLVKVRDDESHAHGSPRSYWIDAICINQKDPEEQTRQVNMMAAIYRSADFVHAWLGNEDSDTGMAFQLMRQLASLCVGNERRKRIEGLKGITPKSLRTEEVVAKLAACADISHWKAMAMLFQRRYFTRAWTIQEITLAQRMLAICGGYTINWEDIVRVSEFLTVSSWTRWISKLTGSHQGNHTVPNILDANKAYNDMLYCLIRSRRFNSADPRDKVYALLGVAGESVQGKSRFAPIYGQRSVAETYTLAAIQILEDSDDLLLLAHAEGDKFRTIPSLPSWVPDWSCNRALGLGITGYRRYSAAATVPRTLKINEKDRCLTVKGFRLDDIVTIGESKEDALHGKPFHNWFSIVNAMNPTYHTGETRSEVFWRTLITDTGGTPPRHPAPHIYHHSYIAWLRPKIFAHAKETIQHIGEASFADALGAIIPTDTSGPLPSSNKPWNSDGRGSQEESLSDPDPDEFETTFSHARYIRLFLTSKGYLGVGSESLRENDSVWIIPGSRVPLILQEVSSGVFRLVGGAYVHGFMKGEALASDPLLSDIIIE